MKRALLVVLLWSSVAAAAVKVQNAPAQPEEPIPKLRLSIVNLLVGRINPLGLEDQLRIGLQEKLYESASPALRDNYLFIGAVPKLSPAFLKFGPSVELQALSVLNLKLTAELYQAFGTFGYIQAFNTTGSDWSDTALNAGKDAGRNFISTGVHLMFEPTIRLKFGPIALVNRFSAEYWNVNLRLNKPLFYEATLDTLVPNNGWVIADDLDVLYLTKFRFIAGIRYSVVAPQYDHSKLLPGDQFDASTNRQQRIGPLFAYTFFRRGYAHFDQPTLVLIVNWYVEHKYRTGADVSAALPYGVLAFAFTSDFILKK